MFIPTNKRTIIRNHPWCGGVGGRRGAGGACRDVACYVWVQGKHVET